MPVAAFPPTSDAAVDPSSGNGLPAPRSQAPAAPGDDSTPAFDQFLSPSKTAGAGSNSKAATANSPTPASRLPSRDPGADPSNPALPAVGPGPVGAMFRRSRSSPAATTADGGATPAPAPATTTPAATAVDPSNVLPAFLPATVPPPPPADEMDAAEPSILPGVSGATGSSSLLPSEAASDPASAPTAAATALTALNAPAAALAGGAATMLPAAAPPPRLADRAGKAANPLTATPLSPPSTTDPAASESPGTDFGLRGLPPASLGVGAKIAAPAPAPFPLAAKALVSGEKKTLITTEQSDRQAPGFVGIDAAQGESTMSADTPDLTAAVRLASLPNLAAPAATAPAAAAAPSASSESASARLAVDAVVKLVDAQTGRSQAPVSAVSLNFKFGSDDLAIRVEWRNGEVHTQFRTDSADLRSALASQWQAMAPSAAGRTTQFADPVFSAGGGSSASTTGAGPDARQYGQPGSSDLPGQSAGARPQRRTAPPRSASLTAVTAAGAPPLPTSLRLHTFA
jgi:hypothetical protein